MPKSEKDIFKPAGSISIQKIEMSSMNSSRPPINLKLIVHEFNIYESVNSTFITADFVVGDALGLTSWFPISGEEIIDIEFKTHHPAFKKSIKQQFQIYAVEKFQSESPRQSRYILKCCTPEKIRDWNTNIRRSYQMPIHDMIKKIYDQYLGTTKELKTIGETEGLRTIVIPNMNPSRAFKFLCREAKSIFYKASNFVFFENCDGFHFCTLDELIEPKFFNDRNTTFFKPIKDKYYLVPKHMQTDKAIKAAVASIPVFGDLGLGTAEEKPFDFMKIVSFEFVNLFNNRKLLGLGGLESTLRIIDVNSALYIEKNYNYFEDAKDFSKTSKIKENTMLNMNNPYMSDGSARIDFILSNKSTEPQGYDLKEEMLHYKNASFALLDNITLDITIPGDSEKRTGEIIEIDFPEFSGVDSELSKVNRMISGKYLITALRHIYNGNGYYCSMRCVKNNYEDTLERTEEKK